jgi:hypothetical protein
MAPADERVPEILRRVLGTTVGAGRAGLAMSDNVPDDFRVSDATRRRIDSLIEQFAPFENEGFDSAAVIVEKLSAAERAEFTRQLIYQSALEWLNFLTDEGLLERVGDGKFERTAKWTPEAQKRASDKWGRR